MTALPTFFSTQRLAFLAASFFLALLALFPGVVSAQNENELCAGANISFDTRESGPGSCARDASGRPVPESAESRITGFIRTAVNLFSIIVGIVAVVMIIYAGFRFITSGGDSASVTTAKNTLLYALLGLIIAVLAQVIVKFVLAKATGVG